MARRWAVVSALALFACPTVRRPESTDFVATGSVYIAGVERGGDPLPGARVRVWPEGNPAGGADTTADDAGTFRLQLGLSAGTRVVVAYDFDGFAPMRRALTAGPSTELSLSAALQPLEELDCSSGSCTVDSDALQVDLAPEGAFGRARAFEPSTELVGLASLETLRATAVAYVELDGGSFDADAGGQPSDAGAIESRLQLRVPFVAWKRLEDARPGTGRIEVPLRALDDATGRWVATGEATLFTESGLEIPESSLDAVRRGEFGPGVVAVGPLPHSGFWALAPPAASPGCVRGTLTVEGSGAEGVFARAVSAEGSASGTDGAFCAAAPLGAGGQTLGFDLQYAGLSFARQQLTLPETAGTCAAGTCREVGPLNLTGANTLVAKPCRVEGTVTDSQGQPLPGAVVVGLDDTVPRNVYSSLCGKLGTRCTLAVATDELGAYSLVLPVQSGVALSGRALVENPGGLDGVREGTTRTAGCPDGPLDFALRGGRDSVAVTLVLNGSQLSWTPALPAAQVRAVDTDGGVKWDLVSPVGLPTPLAYGQVPAGAQQWVPASGSPAPLQSGDAVDVVLIGTAATGYQYQGGVTEMVP